jgi:hypothetical protein
MRPGPAHPEFRCPRGRPAQAAQTPIGTAIEGGTGAATGLIVTLRPALGIAAEKEGFTVLPR